jgi:hypothetical protein
MLPSLVMNRAGPPPSRFPQCLRQGVQTAQSGQTVVLVTMILTVLLACVSVASDFGLFENDRRKMQNAADSAAMAGEQEVNAGNADQAVSAAKNDAALNSYTDGVGGITVTVNNPPLSGPHSGDLNAVEVIVSRVKSTTLLKFVGISTINLAARAVAIEGNALLQTCAIVDDSNASKAFGIFGVALWHASSIGIVGGYDFDLLPFVSPKPVTGIAPVKDPLASLRAPTVGSNCDHTNYSVGPIGIGTLSPGVYCGGITITGAAILHLQPGTYILRGGGLNVLGLSVMTGTGVTFYLTGDSTYPYAGVNILAATVNSLVAPTSGALEGILFFQDRNISAATAAANPNTIVGASLARYEGAFYFPTTKLNYTINASVAAYTALVADTININLVAAGSVNNDYSSLADGSPLKAATLAE